MMSSSTRFLNSVIFLDAAVLLAALDNFRRVVVHAVAVGVAHDDLLRHLAGVQGVDELPHGGAVCVPAAGGHGAADDGARVSG